MGCFHQILPFLFFYIILFVISNPFPVVEQLPGPVDQRNGRVEEIGNANVYPYLLISLILKLGENE
jgi:hypothetical protein